MAYITVQITGGTIFVRSKICVVDTVVLQRRPGLYIIFYRLKKTSFFGADCCNNHNIINANKKIIIASNRANHIAVAISLKIIAFRHFFKIIWPHFTHAH